ncbi:MAG TPA: hypothetical protein VFA53_04955 [Xanthobacteraceae bacterium]|nr:hypothetical protein [Xanthobacteraceae bacterium]
MAATAAVVVGAATVSLPRQAEALPVWVVPAIIGAGVVGVVGGAAAANANAAYYEPRGTVYVEPSAAHAQVCHIVRERTAYGWRRVQVCD